MNSKLSIYLCYLLRHAPWTQNIDMDNHGWVLTSELIKGVNRSGKYKITTSELEEIVKNDNKQRYKFNENHTKIKCCQGHTIDWVEPELEYKEPPEYLYHGTNTTALKKIEHSGSIDKMKRHAVHMQAIEEKAWQSAERWRQTPVVIKIDAAKMHVDGFVFGVTENEVWCTERVPVEYICDRIYVKIE